MNNCIPKVIRKLISSSSCSKLKSFSYKSETFVIGDDVFIGFGSSPTFFRAHISAILFVNDIQPALLRGPTKRIRKKEKTCLRSAKKARVEPGKRRAKRVLAVEPSESQPVLKSNGDSQETPSGSIRKAFPQNKSMVALLVEVRFYLSVDDLEGVHEGVSSAKELFLSQKTHLVYGYNIIGKCFITKGFYSNIDGFYCTRQYDPDQDKILDQDKLVS